MTVRMEPAFDARAFRRALGHFPTGVCVVTCGWTARAIGMTISSFNSLSLDPPLVLFSVDAARRACRSGRRAEGYAINVLAENQKDMSDRFARSARQQMGRNELRRRDCSARRSCLASRRCSNAPHGPRMRRATMSCSSPR